MSKGIDHDLFAQVMRMTPQDRSDILEFMGQSPVSAEGVCHVAALAKRRGTSAADTPADPLPVT